MKLKELHEAISTKNVDSAMKKIIAYIEKSLDIKLVKIMGMEHFRNSKNNGYGTRYVIDGTLKCIRFNWETRGAAGSGASIESIDYWNGRSRDPSLNLKTDGISLVKVLPSVVKHLTDLRVGDYKVFAADWNISESINEILSEAKRGDYSTEATIKDFLKRISRGDSFTRSEFIGVYHVSNVGVFDAIFRNLQDSFTVESKRRLSMSPEVDPYSLYETILDYSDGEIEVTHGGTDEEYTPTAAEEEIEEEAHVSFNDSLEHLESLTIGLIRGSFNALFVAGAAGCLEFKTPINVRVNNKESYDYLNQA